MSATAAALVDRARPSLLGRRGGIVLLLILLGVFAYLRLDLSLGDLVPGEGGRRVAADFFAAALNPALDYEDPVPGAMPFLLRLALALWKTLLFAAVAILLSLLGGTVLGFLASTSWWATGLRGRSSRGWRVQLAKVVQWSVRVGIAGMRSVHELLWAVLFLTAMGVTSGAAVVAIAIPYAGTLAKVFSEMLDEASPRSSEALAAAGVGAVPVFLFGRLPRALPDMVAYTFYRYECAVRSAAVLGFFGYQTLGYFLSQSFNNLHYRETWTYLYAFFALVLLLEGWSILLRKRFTS